MAKRRSRSLSLFHQNNKPTADKLEGVFKSEEDTKEVITADFLDEEDEHYESEDDELFPNCLPPSNRNNSREVLMNQLKFVKAVKLETSVKTREHFKKTIDRIKSNQIEGLNEDDFIAKFQDMHKKLGKFRSLYSIIHDMELYWTKLIAKFAHPDKPKHPGIPLNIFMKEIKANGKHCPPNHNYFKWANQLYNQLSVRDKSAYIKKHEKLMFNYNRKLEEFYEKYPEERPAKKRSVVRKQITPFSLFFDYLRQDDVNVKRGAALELWKNLAIQQKVFYIKKAYQYQSEDANDGKNVIITSKEKELVDELNGKPEKPPTTTYQLYYQENVNDPNISYKTLSGAEKLKLKERLHEMWREYERRFIKYINKLPNEARETEQAEMLKILAKYKNQQSGLKRSASELPDNTVVTEHVSPKKKSKVVGDSSTSGNKSKNVKEATSTKSKKLKLESTETDNTKKSPRKAKPVAVKKVNKDTKKAKPAKPAFTEPKPPKSAFRYFMATNSITSPSTAKKRYGRLSSVEKRNNKKAYNEMCEAYIGRLREYLKSLEKDEMEEFVKELEKKNNEENDDVSYSEDESDSDSGDES